VRTAAVVVNHNTRDELLACLGTLVHAGADEIVVVDAGSSDGSAGAVRAHHPDVRVLELDNLGFGRAANAGVAASGADVVVVANADTRFPAGAVRAMADHLAADERVGALGPLIRFPDGRLQWSARAFPSITQAIGHALLGMWRPDNRWTRAYRLTDWDHLSEREVDWVSGACLALRREAFDAVGGFDPSYFMFVEDVDLCARLWEAGWSVVFSPVAEVTHVVGASVGARPFRMVVEHARSLNFFFTRRYARGWRRVAVPLIRLGLAGWVLAAWLWSALHRRSIGHA
jgi:N-acetylglucosaminyl-diphospho-decaprenol L-rhamnosyltransferase